MSESAGSAATSDRQDSQPLPLSWWIALAVLIANDHWLKGSGILPALITGKLSDFAGLIVAPPVAAQLLRPLGVRSRLVPVLLVAVPFALANTFGGFATGLAGMLTTLGIPSRLWVDPTDLIALVLLPWTWHLMRAAEADNRGGSCANPIAEKRLARAGFTRFGVIAGGAACLATSYPTHSEDNALINATILPVEVRFVAVQGGIACDWLTQPARRSTAALSYEEPRCYTVPPFDSVSLTQYSLRESIESYCPAWVVVIDGLPATFIAFEPGHVSYQQLDDAPEDATYLHDIDGTRLLDPGPDVYTWELGDAASLPELPPELDCPEVY